VNAMSDQHVGIIDTFIKTLSISQTAKEHKADRSTVRKLLAEVGLYQQAPEELREPFSYERNKSVRRYILTSAQNNTFVNQGVLTNLEKLAAHLGAEIKVSKYTYNKGAYGLRNIKPGSSKITDFEPVWYDAAISNYSSPDGEQRDIMLAPDLVWYDRANIMPTAEKPLTGLNGHHGEHSIIVPHARVTLKLVPTSDVTDPKIMMTTGTLTEPNYIQRKAGLKAEWMHSYGGILIEVAPNGTWFMFHLQCENDGSLQHLDIVIDSAGTLTTGNRIEALVPGDVHVAQICENAKRAVWQNSNSIVKTLKPKTELLHDLFDNLAANRHDRNSFAKRYKRYLAGQNNLGDELDDCAVFLNNTAEESTSRVIVRSNHDDSLERWLDEVDYKSDVVNAELYLEAQLENVRRIKDNKPFNFLEWALLKRNIRDVTFLQRDQRFIVAGIDCGNHGDDGNNGTRGSPQVYANIGTPCVVGHYHTPFIDGNAWGTGLLANPDYRRGPRSHAAFCVLIYGNGKRSMVKVEGDQWRA